MTKLTNTTESPQSFFTTFGPVTMAANGGSAFCTDKQFVEIKESQPYKDMIKAGHLVAEDIPDPAILAEAEHDAAIEKAKIDEEARREADRLDAEEAAKKKAEQEELDAAEVKRKAAEKEAKDAADKIAADAKAAEVKRKADEEAAKKKAEADKSGK